MLEQLRAAICFMDIKKRMARICQAEVEIDEAQAEYILAQIRRLAG